MINRLCDRYQWMPLTVVLLAISTVDYLTGLV